MRPRAILAIDQGTTSSKVLLLGENGLALARGAAGVETRLPRPGWVEQDPFGIWNSVREAIEHCLAGAGEVDILGIGISNQRESTLGWDARTGVPIGPCVTWQCRRTSAICDSLRVRGLAPTLERLTGLTIDPLFSASKMRWLLDQAPDGQARAEAGEIKLGTVDSWLVWQLTNAAMHATDASNAARTQLVDIASGHWSPQLLGEFNIPEPALPRIQASSAFFGEVAAIAALRGVPILGVMGDSHAALFAHGSFQPGTVKATYGTGSSLMTLSKGRREGAAMHGLSQTIAWQLGDAPSLAFEGNIASSGGTLEWLGSLFGLADPGNTIAQKAQQVSGSEGVYLVPAFNGLGAPHWDDQARGLICGLNRSTDLNHLARAAMESIAFQVADVFDAMEQTLGHRLTELRADGGASRNDFLMQFQADLIGRPMLRDRSADLSAIGAGWMAGLAAGLWPSLEALARLPRTIDRFEPVMSLSAAQALRRGWQDAVARSKLHPFTGAMHGQT